MAASLGTVYVWYHGLAACTYCGYAAGQDFYVWGESLEQSCYPCTLELQYMELLYKHYFFPMDGSGIYMYHF